MFVILKQIVVWPLVPNLSNLPENDIFQAEFKGVFQLTSNTMRQTNVLSDVLRLFNSIYVSCFI